jgi:hypothetical protein
LKVDTLLRTRIEQFAKELNDSNVAFILVYTTPDSDPHWHTNLQRCTQNVVDRVRHALNEAGHAIAKKKPTTQLVLPS